MKDLFRKAGVVLHTDVNTDPGYKRPNGTGTVVFSDSKTTRAAIGK
jgi:RNA recognition motif-containing protein